MTRALAAAFVVIAATAAAQVGPRVPGVDATERRERYGKPRDRERAEPAELWQITNGAFERRNVRVRGHLSPTTDRRYWLLREGGGEALIIPMELGGSLRELQGRRVEVVGYVRLLHHDQGICEVRPQVFPQSYCDDPDLPPTPNLKDHPGFPRYSITAWTTLELTGFDAKGRGGPTSPLADLLDGEPSKEKVTVRGRFCGAGLCGGLATPPPEADAWVLVDGDTAVWVVGRKANGKGFRLDPRYQGDTARWVEVTGQVERCGPVPCLRAKSVALAAPPKPEEPEDPEG